MSFEEFWEQEYGEHCGLTVMSKCRMNISYDAGVESQQTIIDDLKTQLNNMEACYIEKKKHAELLESNIKNLVMQLSNNYEVAEGEYKKNADSYYSGKCDAFDLAEQLVGLVLRGEHE